MKTLFRFLILMLISISASSQVKDDLAIAECSYKFTHKYDTTNLKNEINENYILLVGKFSSVYYSKDRYVQDSLTIENAKKTGTVMPPVGRRYNAEKIYLFQDSKKLYITSHTIIGKYIVEKSFPELNWKLYKDTIHYNGYILNKATTVLNGRNYICWYAPSLPFKAGPWKLNGLPGLIFKAYEENNRISFELTNFKQAISNENIKWNSSYKNISWDEYLKLVYFERDDPDGFAQIRFPGIQITSSVTSSERKKISRGTILDLPAYINFPLEDRKYIYLR